MVLPYEIYFTSQSLPMVCTDISYWVDKTTYVLYLKTTHQPMYRRSLCIKGHVKNEIPILFHL